MAVIIGVVVNVRVVAVVPAWTVNVVVEGVVVLRRPRDAHEVVVGRHRPHKRRPRMARLKAQV